MLGVLANDIINSVPLLYESNKRIRIAPDTLAENRLRTSPLDACHARVQKYYDYINRHRISEQQRAFIQMCTNSMARTFYGDLFDANMPAILRKWGWTEPGCAPIIRFLSGRRIGKSWAMSFMIAALMIAFPGSLPYIFSPSLYQSQLLLKLVERDLYEYAPDLANKMKCCVTNIQINFGNGVVSKCTATPASSKVSAKRTEPKRTESETSFKAETHTR